MPVSRYDEYSITGVEMTIVLVSAVSNCVDYQGIESRC